MVAPGHCEFNVNTLRVTGLAFPLGFWTAVARGAQCLGLCPQIGSSLPCSRMVITTHHSGCSPASSGEDGECNCPR